MNRRDILRFLATGTAWPLVDRLMPDDLLELLQGAHAAAQFEGPGMFRALDARAAATVAAACERIIPADESPGATAAGVPRFIDHMLAAWYEPEERDQFLRGLGTLDIRSEVVGGRPFVHCPSTVQDAVLSACDAEVQALDVDRRGTHWFGMLKYLTVWGYCTSEIGMKTELRLYPQPMKYDGFAPYKART